MFGFLEQEDHQLGTPPVSRGTYQGEHIMTPSVREQSFAQPFSQNRENPELFPPPNPYSLPFDGVDVKPEIFSENTSLCNS